MRRHVLISLLLATTLGCHGTSGVGVHPGVTPKPPKVTTQASPGTLETAADLVSKARLTGKVKLLSDLTTGVLDGKTGHVLSDNGLGLVGSDGSGVLSDNGLGLVSKARYGLTDAAPAQEALLANAEVTLTDAQGQPLKDAAGKPLVALTDATGTYVFPDPLPAQALVLRVKLWADQGELAALLPASDATHREQPIDTASSLGAAFVLDQYVKGSQATLEKLPAAEADKLHGQLDGARAAFAKPPKYDAAALVGLTKDLRAKNPAVDQTLGEIRALLLGQANLGEGLRALEVPLSDPRALAPDGAGGYYVAEGVLGRIRHVAADGTLTTLADGLHGQVKQNFYGIMDLARGADGSLYVAAGSTAKVSRIKPDGTVTVVAGTGRTKAGATGQPGPQTDLVPRTVAVAADGTVWIGEADPADAAARVLSVGADGVLHEPAPAAWPRGRSVVGLAQVADGTWYALIGGAGVPGQVFRLAPGGASWEAMPWPLSVDDAGDLAAAPDGGLWLAADFGGLLHLALDGTSTVLIPQGGPRPSDLMPWPDGHLRFIDVDHVVVQDRDATGKLAQLAGTGPVGSVSQDAIAINSPFGAAVAPDGSLYLTELASHSLKRLHDGVLEAVAGGIKGFGGDGGPAKTAQFNEPAALAFQGGQPVVWDRVNGRLRRIDANGVITTVVGGGSLGGVLPVGPALAPGDLSLFTSGALAVDGAGLLVFCTVEGHQVLRLDADGKVRVLAGTGKGDAGDGGPAAAARFNTPSGLAFGPDGALYVADALNCRIRRIPDPKAASPTLEAFAGVDGLGAIARFSAQPLPDGPRQDAVFAFPTSLCFDKAGNLYVGEVGTLALPLLGQAAQSVQDLPAGSLPAVPARVRKIAPDGTVTTIAGPGGKFFADTEAGDALVLPSNLAIDAQGRLAIVDTGANLVRLLPAGSY